MHTRVPGMQLASLKYMCDRDKHYVRIKINVKLLWNKIKEFLLLPNLAVGPKSLKGKYGFDIWRATKILKLGKFTCMESN